MTMTNIFKPIGDKLIIKPFSYANRTNSGVYIPDIAQESLNIGRVIAKGPGPTLITGKSKPMIPEIGDIVMFPKFGTYQFEIGDENYISLKEQDILTIITDESILDKLNLTINEE